MPFGRLGGLFSMLLSATAFVAVILLTSCGGSPAPVIVSGDIETRGAKVWVRVHGEPYIGDIAAQDTDGEFELRGEFPASQARALSLLVEPCCYASICSAEVKLPPLRLSGKEWVNARTGQPVVINVELHEMIGGFASPKPYAEKCPEDQGVSETSTQEP